MADALRRALLDVFERVLLEFAEFAREVPPDVYDVPVPGEEGSVRAIFGHVIRAGYGHVRDVAQHCGGTIPERRFEDPAHLNDADTVTAALLDVVRFSREALTNVSDEAIERTTFEMWNTQFTGEQMMEHATCHPGRHVRQLRRFFDGELTG
jgi:hypothetical protein